MKAIRRRSPSECRRPAERQFSATLVFLNTASHPPVCGAQALLLGKMDCVSQTVVVLRTSLYNAPSLPGQNRCCEKKAVLPAIAQIWVHTTTQETKKTKTHFSRRDAKMFRVISCERTELEHPGMQCSLKSRHLAFLRVYVIFLIASFARYAEGS